MVGAFGRRVDDLVVVVPGILGSRLAKNGKEVWGTAIRRLLVNLSTFGRTLTEALTIPAEADPDDPQDGVEATGLTEGLTVIPGLLGADYYDGLRKHLRADLELVQGQLVDFPYDWRLSSRVNGARLTEFLGRNLDAYAGRTGRSKPKAILVCHSMGGLVARWSIEIAGARDLVSTLVTIGTPHKGSVLALDAIVNGVRVPRRAGNVAIDLTDMALSFPSIYELLPTYSCVTVDGAPAQRLATATVLRRVTSLCREGTDGKIERGLEFHTELARAIGGRAKPGHDLVCVRGAEQPTAVAASINYGGLDTSETIDEVRHGGDGVVPDDSAVPSEWTSATAAKVAEQRHASMSNGLGVREELRVALRHSGRLLAPPVNISARMPSAVQEAESFEIRITPVDGAQGGTPPLNLAVRIEPLETTPGTATTVIKVKRKGEDYRASVPGLGRGLYRLVVEKATNHAIEVDSLSDALVVYGRPDRR